MNRRRFLLASSGGALTATGGCLGTDPAESGTSDEERADDADTQNGDDDGETATKHEDDGSGENDDEDPEYKREHVRPEPPAEGDTLDYEFHVVRMITEDPLIRGGYLDNTTERDDENRVTLITAETADRLRLEPLESPRVDYEEGDRSFLEAIDFETSSLLTFEQGLQGNEKFGVEAILREDEDHIHAYTCRFGNPQPPSMGDVAGDLGPNPHALFIRIDIPELRTATLTHGWYHRFEQEAIADTFQTGID